MKRRDFEGFWSRHARDRSGLYGIYRVVALSRFLSSTTTFLIGTPINFYPPMSTTLTPHVRVSQLLSNILHSSYLCGALSQQARHQRCVLSSSLSPLHPRLNSSLNCSVVGYIPLTTDLGARGQLLRHNDPPSHPRRERLRLWNSVYQQSH
jgi:hypothetical protein